MSDQTKSIFKLGMVLAFLLGGGILFFNRLGDASRTGEEGARVWFYDESERKLYPTGRETIPPHQGIGGPRGDGVRAMVAASKGGPSPSADQRVAYLETYTPELKRLLEDVRAARMQKRNFPVPIPPRDSEYFGTNTLVRRLHETRWHVSSSQEGREIMREWRKWHDSDGQPLSICLP